MVTYAPSVQVVKMATERSMLEPNHPMLRKVDKMDG